MKLTDKKRAQKIKKLEIKLSKLENIHYALYSNYKNIIALNKQEEELSNDLDKDFEEIKYLIEEMDSVESKVLVLTFRDKKSISQIAEELHYTGRQIAKYRASCIDKIKKALKSAKIKK